MGEYASREYEKYISDLLAASPVILAEAQGALTVQDNGGPVYAIDSPTLHDRAMARYVVKAMNHHDPLIKALGTLVDSLDHLISDSYGVAGLHLNGEIVPWGDLTEGGRYQEWLSSLEEARATLAAVKGA